MALLAIEFIGLPMPTSPRPAPLWAPISSCHSSNDGNDNDDVMMMNNHADVASIQDIQQALLNTGLSFELVHAAVQDVHKIDAYTQRAMKHIALIKQECIMKEDFGAAKVLTEHLAVLTEVGKQVSALAALKSDAIAREAYDDALQYHQVH